MSSKIKHKTSFRSLKELQEEQDRLELACKEIELNMLDSFKLSNIFSDSIGRFSGGNSFFNKNAIFGGKSSTTASSTNPTQILYKLGTKLFGLFVAKKTSRTIFQVLTQSYLKWQILMIGFKLVKRVIKKKAR